MSNGQDNSGKPPPGSGLPQIAPVRAPPRVSAPAIAPLVPQVTPAQGQPPPRPAQAPGAPPSRPSGVQPAGAPAVRLPPITAQTVLNAPNPLMAPPAVGAPTSRPSGVIAVGPSGKAVAPGYPQRPATPVIAPPVMAAPVAPPRVGAPLVPPAAPARPGAPLVPPAPLGARPLIPSAAPGPAANPRPSPLPAAGAVETIDAQQAAALSKLADGLDTIDYYQSLGLPQSATPGDIKKAFYRESRIYHPDRFFHLPDSQVKTDIGSIYKRITEAYYVLRDDAKRKKYASDMAGPDRAHKLRYTEASETEVKAEARKTVEEEFGTNPKARPFFKTALAELERGNLPAAVSAFKMGLTYEPGNVRFKEKLVEAQKKIEDARRGLGPSYMIK